MKYYMNLETGELLTRDEMVKQAQEEYDIGDPTNYMDWEMYYTEV